MIMTIATAATPKTDTVADQLPAYRALLEE